MSKKTKPPTTIDHAPFLTSDERGATAIEYALIACGVGAAIASTVFSFGSDLKTTFYDRSRQCFSRE
jgi:Flp pilus assembly pilin Flp